ncbi:MAG: hypothetical protein K0R66_327 [Gammaproteobacteria bacterium]|jgi:hypothetical protein|nr:hypothetical protein [Gammaproteobacteria bacterium]
MSVKQFLITISSIGQYLKLRLPSVGVKTVLTIGWLIISAFILAPILLKFFDNLKGLYFQRVSFFDEYFHVSVIHSIILLALIICLTPTVIKIFVAVNAEYTSCLNLIDRTKEIENTSLLEAISNSRNRVLLLNGGWGCGKTTLFQKLLRFKLKGAILGYKLIYISSFGISDTSDLITQILNKTGFWEHFSIFFKLFRLAIESSIQFKQSLIPKQCFIVIDDFERLKPSMYREVLGLIDYLVHQKNCRFLLICDENKIKAPTFKDFKEKVVDKTIPCPISKELLSQIIDRQFPELIKIKNIALKHSDVEYNLRCVSRSLSAYQELQEKFQGNIKKVDDSCSKVVFTIIWQNWQPVIYCSLYLKARNSLEEYKNVPSLAKGISAQIQAELTKNDNEMVIRNSDPVVTLTVQSLGSDFSYLNDQLSLNSPPNWLKIYLETDKFDFNELVNDPSIISICYYYLIKKISNYDDVFCSSLFDILEYIAKTDYRANPYVQIQVLDLFCALLIMLKVSKIKRQGKLRSLRIIKAFFIENFSIHAINKSIPGMMHESRMLTYKLISVLYGENTVKRNEIVNYAERRIRKLIQKTKK